MALNLITLRVSLEYNNSIIALCGVKLRTDHGVHYVCYYGVEGTSGVEALTVNLYSFAPQSLGKAVRGSLHPTLYLLCCSVCNFHWHWQQDAELNINTHTHTKNQEENLDR